MANFPFKPLEDHLLGSLIGKVWLTIGSFEELNESIYSNLKEDEKAFICSNKGDKMLYLDLYPTKFRKYIEQNNFELLYLDFENILKEKNPKLDIAFDLLEWLFIGFENDELTIQLLHILTNKKIHFTQKFIDSLKLEYSTMN